MNLAQIMNVMNSQKLKSEQLFINYMQFWYHIVEDYLVELTHEEVDTMMKMFAGLSEFNSSQQI